MEILTFIEKHFEIIGLIMGAIIKSTQFERGDNAWTNRTGVDQDHDGSVSSTIAYWVLGDTSNTIALSGDEDLWNQGLSNILDTTSTITLNNIGINGVTIIDVTPLTGSAIVNEAQTIGYDSLGTNIDSLDIFGNVRTSPDIGAIEKQ